MGVQNYFVEGVSGAGKTSVATELERRGYQVIHGDRTLAYYGDPETGEPAGDPSPHITDPLAWRYDRWIWPVDKVAALLADHSRPVTFFCGGARNSHQFLDRFDGVFILDIDRDTLNARLDARPDDEYGRAPEERQVVLRAHATEIGLPKIGTHIDATQPLAAVVDDILAGCGE